MKPFEEWPMILDSKDLEDCLGVSRTDAYAILKRGPVIDPAKKRDRHIARGPLWDYLNKRSEDEVRTLTRAARFNY